MFKTHESAYYNLAPVFGPEHHHWKCSGQPIPDSGLSFSSATAGGSPPLN